jgi:hypothetical protein
MAFSFASYNELGKFNLTSIYRIKYNIIAFI